MVGTQFDFRDTDAWICSDDRGMQALFWNDVVFVALHETGTTQPVTGIGHY
jgi:hypothetical protein